MNLQSDFPELAPVPRRARIDRGADGRAAPRRVRSTVEVRVFDPVEVKIVTETAEVYVRALPDVLAAMPPRLRAAALAYAKAIEEVEAGGATDPEARGQAGAPAIRKEGRQFHAIRHVQHLRAIEAAVGADMIRLGKRRGESVGVAISRLAALRAVALDGLSVAALLATLRLGRSAARQKIVISSLLEATGAIADALGLTDDPEKIEGGAKKGLQRSATASCSASWSR